MVIACPISPPVDDSAVASRHCRSRSSSPSRRARASSAASSGGRVIAIGQRSAVVGELQGDRVVERPEVTDHRLQLVLALGRDPHCVALDDRLDLREPIADALRELLGLVGREASLQVDLLAHRATGSGLQATPVEHLQRQATPHSLGLDQVTDRLRTELVVGGQRDLGLAQLERATAPLEVETGGDLAPHLVEGVHQLLLGKVADDVEARFPSHCSSSALAPLSRQRVSTMRQVTTSPGPPMAPIDTPLIVRLTAPAFPERTMMLPFAFNETTLGGLTTRPETLDAGTLSWSSST